MDQIAKLKDAVVNYLSPAAKRRRTMGPQTPTHEAAGEPLFLSEPRNKKALGNAYGRLNQSYHSSPGRRQSATNPLKRSRQDDEAGEYGFSADEVSPERSSSPIGSEDDDMSLENTEDEDEDEDEDEEEEEEEDEALIANRKVQEYLRRQSELVLAKERVENARAAGEWLPEEIFLLERLELRGHEPVLPSSWRAYHFRQVPEAMWDSQDKSAFIGYNLGDGERGFGALEELTTKLGWRLQARKSVNGPTEALMEQIIQHYITWTEKDGGYHRKKFIPVLCLIRGRWGASSSEVQKTLKDQMNYLARRHRETLLLPKPITTATGEVEIYSRRPPIIYGILCAQMKTIFVTMDSSDPNAAIRHIGHCDFDDSTKHFWNGLSIAIVATVAKRYMMSIKDELEDDPPVFDPYEDELESPSDAERRLRRQAKREKKQREREEMLRLESKMNGVEMEKNEDQQAASEDKKVEAAEDEDTETEQTGYAAAEASEDDETEGDKSESGGNEDEYQQDEEDEEMTDDYDGEGYPESTSSDELSHL
ncbi:hypothetical protein ACMFMG_009170 [Clarireedia jacksonii]